MISDYFVPIALIAALVLCSPGKAKWLAVAFCLFVDLTQVGVRHFFWPVDHPGWAYYLFSMSVETFACIGLIYWGYTFKRRGDQVFAMLMGLMFFASACVTAPYLWIGSTAMDVYLRYAALSHAVALVHVALAIGLSDGVGSVLQSIYHTLHDRWRYRGHMGG